MKGQYSPGVWVSLADCTEQNREADFNKWYNEMMSPNLQSLGFIRNTTRFENVLSHSPTFMGLPKYLTISEVYRDDLKPALKEIRQKQAELAARGKGFDPKVEMIDTLFGRVGPEIRTERAGRPVMGIYLVVCYPTDPARETEFNDWYNQKHGPEALALGFYDIVYRYQIVEPNDLIPNHSSYITLYETSIDPLEARQKLISFRPKWFADRQWVDLLGVGWTGGFRPIYPPIKA